MTRKRHVWMQLLGTGGGELLARLSQLGSLGLLGWQLGPGAVAVVGTAWSLTAITLAITQAGPELAGVGTLVAPGGHPDHGAAQVVADVTRLKLVLSIAALPPLLLAGAIVGHGTGTALGQLGLQYLAMLLSAVGYAWVFRSLWRPVEQGGLRAVQALVALGLLAVLVTVWRSPLTVPVAETLAALLTLLLGWWRLGSLAGVSPRWSSVRRLAGPSIRLGLTTVFSIATWLSPILLAARTADAEQVSYLTGTMRLLIGVTAVQQIALQALYPALAASFAEGAARGSDATIGVTVLSLMATLLGLAALMPLAASIVPLCLGPGFVEAGPLFRALLPVLIPLAILSPVNYAMIARNESRLLFLLQFGASVTVIGGMSVLFAIRPSAWNAMLFHPAQWIQMALTLLVAWRCGAIALPTGSWGKLLRAPLAIIRHAPSDLSRHN